jgi:2-methylcitrate dehydratase PrpD
MFGSMAKFLHAGFAAKNGYTSAILADAGFTAGEQSIEGPRGFAAVQALKYDLTKITRGLGVEFQIRENAYKPYPCGVVVHPTIDGCIEIYREFKPTPVDIRAVRLRVAPLVMDLCNKRNITQGLESKYSIYHGAAIGLVRGKGGLREFSDEAAVDPDIQRVRNLVTPTPDASITEDQSHIEVEFVDGRKVTRFVEQSLGNLQRPLTDTQLEEKFRDQAQLVLPAAQVERLIGLCWRIEDLDAAGEILKASVPS